VDWQISPAHALVAFVVAAVWLAILVGLIVLVAYIVVRVARSTWREPGPSSPPRDSAMDVLRERYARGEIDAAEFEERRRLLES
jgi:putative membrane protein